MNFFFTMNPNLNYFLRGGGVKGGRGARGSELFFTKNPNLKKKLGGGRVGEGKGIGGGR